MMLAANKEWHRYIMIYIQYHWLYYVNVEKPDGKCADILKLRAPN
jgi:hypothetical protein